MGRAFESHSGSSLTAFDLSFNDLGDAGVAAIALQQHPSYSPAQVKSWITSNAMSGLVSNPGTGTPNVMLHVPC